MSRPQLKVGGQHVQALAHYADLEVVDRWGGGCWEMSWQMNLPPGVQPTWLTSDAVVELDAGGLRWGGTLTEPDWDTGEFTALGWCRQGDTAAALDLSGATNHPGDAVFYANARGAISWGAVETFTPLADPAREVNTVGALLDQWCLENGRRWAVTEQRLLYTAEDRTDPTMWVLPGVVDLGVSALEATTCVIGWYYDTALTGRMVTAAAGVRTEERLVDLTDLGPISTARAQTIVDQILERSGSGLPRFTSGFELAPGQVVNGGGMALDLSLVRPGHVVRLHGMEDPRTGAAWTDVLIGETQWRPQEDRVQVNPINLDASDFTSIVEDLGGKVVL